MMSSPYSARAASTAIGQELAAKAGYFNQPEPPVVIICPGQEVPQVTVSAVPPQGGPLNPGPQVASITRLLP